MSKENIIPILETLISFDTTSRHSNLALIQYIEEYLSPWQVALHRDSNAEASKANLLATIGSDDRSALLFSGHTDVVPVDDQEWTTDPFALEVVDKKCFGRGTTDMKGFLAVVLALVPEMVRSGKTIHLAFSYDEEVGCQGVPSLLSYMQDQKISSDLVLIGEPTRNRLCNSHKGIHRFITLVEGKEAHSSATDHGVSAILIAGECLAALHQMEQRLRQRTDYTFSPPYSSLHVGTIHGGTAENIIPRHCEFHWEVRPLPDEDMTFISAEYARVCHHLEQSFHAKIITTALPVVGGLRADNHPLEPFLASLFGQPMSVSFGTEAGLFQRYGMPVYVCGPGDIAQAHMPNEFVEISELHSCYDRIKELIYYQE